MLPCHYSLYDNDGQLSVFMAYYRPLKYEGDDKWLRKYDRPELHQYLEEREDGYYYNGIKVEGYGWDYILAYPPDGSGVLKWENRLVAPSTASSFKAWFEWNYKQALKEREENQRKERELKYFPHFVQEAMLALHSYLIPYTIKQKRKYTPIGNIISWKNHISSIMGYLYMEQLTCNIFYSYKPEVNLRPLKGADFDWIICELYKKPVDVGSISPELTVFHLSIDKTIDPIKSYMELLEPAYEEYKKKVGERKDD